MSNNPLSSLADKNIYAYNILKAGQSQYNQSYSYLFSSLLHFESELDFGRIPLEQFAESLLSIINQSGAFRKLDRVCLSITHPGTSRIFALSSHNTERLQNNQMIVGYNCFVSSTSSIFKTKKSNVRIYSNIDDIITLYDSKPVQRSMRLLKEMGVKSGVTIPLAISNVVSGFLFLNSADEAKFSDLKSEDYSLLCLIKLLGLSFLNQSLSGLNELNNGVGDLLAETHQSDNTFSSEPFSDLLKKALKLRFNQKVDVIIHNHFKIPFFYAFNPAVYSIVKLMELAVNIPSEIIIELNEKKVGNESFVELSIPSLSFASGQVSYLKDLTLLTQQNIGLEGDQFFMRTGLDLSNEFGYSV